ncbi:MAG: hypothetical protein KGL46_09805 [Hyphomicrobiales bacterium]|nr:hypothetical protein [Hyphomicrobiales bacterium]
MIEGEILDRFGRRLTKLTWAIIGLQAALLVKRPLHEGLQTVFVVAMVMETICLNVMADAFMVPLGRALARRNFPRFR